jgi:hypothetical protein
MIPDDRMELLMRLSPVVPIDVDVLVRGLGWVTTSERPDWERYHRATHAIAEMDIALRTNPTGDTLIIHRDSWPKAQDRANSYYELMYPFTPREASPPQRSSECAA